MARLAAKKPLRVALRVFSGNRLTFPLLLNVWEEHGLDQELSVVIVDGEPGRLGAGLVAAMRGCAAAVYSFMTPHLPGLAAEIAMVRAAGGRAPLLAAGGPHVNGEHELAAACGFDLLFRGAGEENFLRLGRELLGGKLQAGSGPGVITAAAGAGRDWERYIPVSRRFPTVPPLEITRGCHWRCRYCQTGGSRPRHRGADSIARYLGELRRRGLPRVGFISPSALEFGSARPGETRRERIEWLLRACRAAGFRLVEYGIFPSEIRPGRVSREDLQLLHGHVANRRLTFGVQSAVEGRLRAIGRAHTAADVEEAVALANEAGFAANLDFIIALPGETAEERRELLAFAARLRRRRRVFIQLHHFFPLAGSAFSARMPSFLDAAERRAFAALHSAGLASDWWLEGERSVRAYLSWLEREHPGHFASFT